MNKKLIFWILGIAVAAAIIYWLYKKYANSQKQPLPVVNGASTSNPITAAQAGPVAVAVPQSAPPPPTPVPVAATTPPPPPPPTGSTVTNLMNTGSGGLTATKITKGGTVYTGAVLQSAGGL